MKVCAVVVTYNRKELLVECIQSLLKQTYPLSAIYCIDNASTDGTGEYLFQNGFLQKRPSTPYREQSLELSSLSQNVKKKIKFHYIPQPENLGGAGGFHEGVVLAYRNGYDWLWLMDDDAEPGEDALEKLSPYFDQDGISALTSAVTVPDGSIALNHRGFIDYKKMYPAIKIPVKQDKYSLNDSIQIDLASFVGILIKGKAVDRIGYPRKEFFIHHDDADYCIRLKEFGDILLIPGSVIIHKENAAAGVHQKKLFIWKYNSIPYNRFWLSFFGKRNHVWLCCKYSSCKTVLYAKMFVRYIKTIIGICFFDDNKLKRIMLINRAYYDGFNSHFDNDIPKKILYNMK